MLDKIFILAASTGIGILYWLGLHVLMACIQDIYHIFRENKYE